MERLGNFVGALDGVPNDLAAQHRKSEFWKNKTIEELAAEQKVKPVQNLNELAGDWPDEDSVDEFLAFVRKVRA